MHCYWFIQLLLSLFWLKWYPPSMDFRELLFKVIMLFNSILQLYFNPATVKMLSNLKVHLQIINITFLLSNDITGNIIIWIVLEFRVSHENVTSCLMAFMYPNLYLWLSRLLCALNFAHVWLLSVLDTCFGKTLLSWTHHFLNFYCFIMDMQVLVIAVLLKMIMKRRFSIIQVKLLTCQTAFLFCYFIF